MVRSTAARNGTGRGGVANRSGSRARRRRSAPGSWDWSGRLKERVRGGLLPLWPFDRPAPERLADRPGDCLCLLQADAAWSGRDSIVDLLLKAAGWRIEYALMRAGLVRAMTVHGIADDDSLDHLGATACPDEPSPAGGDPAE